MHKFTYALTNTQTHMYKIIYQFFINLSIDTYLCRLHMLSVMNSTKLSVHMTSFHHTGFVSVCVAIVV